MNPGIRCILPIEAGYFDTPDASLYVSLHNVNFSEFLEVNTRVHGRAVFDRIPITIEAVKLVTIRSVAISCQQYRAVNLVVIAAITINIDFECIRTGEA